MTRPSFDVSGSSVYAVMQIVNYLQEKISGPDEKIDAIPLVERHAGKFDDEQDIKKYMSNKNGGVRVCATAIKDIKYQSGYGVTGTIEFAIFVFCADHYGYKRDIRAEVISGHVSDAIASADCALKSETKAINVNAMNLHDVKIDSLGLAIWAVTFSQEWRLDAPIDIAELDDFLQVDHTQIIEEDAPSQQSIINVRNNT